MFIQDQEQVQEEVDVLGAEDLGMPLECRVEERFGVRAHVPLVQEPSCLFCSLPQRTIIYFSLRINTPAQQCPCNVTDFAFVEMFSIRGSFFNEQQNRK